MIYVFDIDGTICTKAVNFDYEGSKPIKKRIDIVNRLYKENHTIIFQTARGMGRFDNIQEKAIDKFYEMTKKQLSDWGVKYHMLFLGKPGDGNAGSVMDQNTAESFYFSIRGNVVHGISID